MLTDHLFHPNHVVPTIELVATLTEFAHEAKPQVLVKLHAVFGQKLVFNGWVTDTGV